RTRYFADLRYIGQLYEISVPIAKPFSIARIRKDFLAIYKRRYGHQHEEDIEFTSLKTQCSSAKRTKLSFGGVSDDTPTTLNTRRAYFDGRWHQATVTGRGRVRPGSPVRGPAIIEEYGATTVVPPGWTVRHGRGDCLLLLKR